MFSITSGLQGFLDAAAVQPVSLADRAASEPRVFLSCRFEVLLALKHEHVGPAVRRHAPLPDLLSLESLETKSGGLYHNAV